MTQMIAKVGFSMHGVSAAAGATFYAPNKKAADALVAAGVARKAAASDAAPADTEQPPKTETKGGDKPA